MSAFGVRLDPSGTVLNVADNSAYFLMGLEAPEPAVNAQWAGAVGVDGDLLVDSRYGNRQVTATIRVVGSTDAQLEDRVQTLQAAVGKQHREGGELELTTPAGTVVTFDVLDASFNVGLDKRYMTRQVAQAVLVFTCKPLARGAEVAVADAAETSLPCLSFTAGIANQSFESNIAGWAFTESGTGGATTFLWTNGQLEVRKSSTLSGKYIGATFDGGIASGAQPWIPVTPGQACAATADCYVQSAPASSRVQLQIEFLTAAGDWCAAATSPETSGTGSKSLAASGVAPANAAYTRLLLLQFNGGTTGDCHTYWQGVTLDAGMVPGDVPALGRLIVDEDDGDSQTWVLAAIRSRRYSADADCALFYQAESRTLLGGGAATASTGYTGAASGSGSNVVDVDHLATSWEAVLSTQATGGGSHLQHVGGYRVWARVQASSTNTGVVGVCLEWAPGDFRNPARNHAVYLTDTRLADGTPVEDKWLLVDLGVVNIPPVLTGSQFWEGRVLAKSSVYSDRFFIDHLFFAHVDEFYAEAAAGTVAPAASAFTAQDDFSSGTYASGLAGDTLPAGGTWTAPASAYEADDFTAGGGSADRTATADAATDARYGRWMYPSGTAAMTNTAVQVDMGSTASVPDVRQGVVARAVDKDNFLVAYLDYSPTWRVWVPYVVKVVAGTPTTIAIGDGVPGGTRRLRLIVDAGGSFSLYAGATTGLPDASSDALSLVAAGQDAALATGGALDDGYAGIYDWNTGGADTRIYDNFFVWVPTLDAAVFANQSLQFRHDGVIREDSGGSFWQPVSVHTGDMLLVPPSGREARTCEVLVKACRNNPRTGVDSAIDDISARLFVTPRYLTIPT